MPALPGRGKGKGKGEEERGKKFDPYSKLKLYKSTQWSEQLEQDHFQTRARVFP